MTNTYVFNTASGSGAQAVVPVGSFIPSGATLTVEFSADPTFGTVTLSKPLTLNGTSVTISLTATEVDLVKDDVFRIKSVKGARTEVVVTGRCRYTPAKPSTGGGLTPAQIVADSTVAGAFASKSDLTNLQAAIPTVPTGAQIAADPAIAGAFEPKGAVAAQAATDAVTYATKTDLSGKAPLVGGVVPDANIPARLSDASLKAAYVPKWKASTAYASGEFVLNPSGQIVSANTAFTSGTTYSAGNWTLVSGGGSGGGIPFGNTNYTGNQTAPLLQVANASNQASIHLMQAAGFTGAYLLGIGNDTGNMPGALISNKAGGVGLVVKQNNTITSSTAYAIQVDQQSTLAAGVRIEGNVANAADLLQVLNFQTSTDATKNLLYLGDLAGPIGRVRATDGALIWNRDMQLQDPQSGVARYMNVPADGTGSAYASYSWQDKTGVVALAASGSANQWFATRLYAPPYAGQLKLQGGGTVAATDAATVAAATWKDAITINMGGSVGFFGKSPVNQATGTPANATDLASAIALVNALRAALVNIGIAA